LSFLKKKGQGFSLLSGLGTTKHNKSCAGKTIKETLRLSAFARNPVKPAKTGKKPEKARDKEKITARKGCVIRVLRKE
jgi:hypothetical protein